MESSKKQVFYDDLVFQVFDQVYEPAEDSFLAADSLNQVIKKRDFVLDIGTGCGMLAIIAAKTAQRVIATDINPYAVKCAKLNAENNHVESKIEVRLGDLFKPIRKNEKFNVNIFNAPYLPSCKREQETYIGRAWAGGRTGRRIIDQFIVETPRYLKRDGRILLVQSSLTKIGETLRKLQEVNLKPKILAEQKVAFETIVAIQANYLH
jgi:release factor glutamine methyltransferase